MMFFHNVAIRVATLKAGTSKPFYFLLTRELFGLFIIAHEIAHVIKSAPWKARIYDDFTAH